MRYLALWVALLMATPVVAQQEPEHLSDYVFVHDIWEHKVIMSAPFGFDESDRGYNNLRAWAHWACQFYKRVGAGPLNSRQASTQACQIVNMMTHPQATNPRQPTPDQRNACQVFHLFACAIR